MLNVYRRIHDTEIIPIPTQRNIKKEKCKKKLYFYEIDCFKVETGILRKKASEFGVTVPTFKLGTYFNLHA